MADRTFPPLDRLNVLLHRRRLRPAFLIVSSTEFVDVVPLATHGFRLPAHVETHETVVHCSTVFAAWTYLDREDCVPFDADALEEAASALCKEFLSNPLQAGAMPDRIRWYAKCCLRQCYERGSPVRAVTFSLRGGTLAGARYWRTSPDCRRVSPFGNRRVPRGIVGASAVLGHHRTVAEGLERSSPT
jgi:hypothetical protein